MQMPTGLLRLNCFLTLVGVKGFILTCIRISGGVKSEFLHISGAFRNRTGADGNRYGAERILNGAELHRCGIARCSFARLRKLHGCGFASKRKLQRCCVPFFFITV